MGDHDGVNHRQGEDPEPDEPRSQADREQRGKRDVQPEDHEQTGGEESSEHGRVDDRTRQDDDEHDVQRCHVARWPYGDDDQQKHRDERREEINDPDPCVAGGEPLNDAGDGQNGGQDEGEKEHSAAAASGVRLVGRGSDRQDGLEEALPAGHVGHLRNLLRRPS